MMGVTRSSFILLLGVATAAIVSACGDDDDFKSCKSVQCCSDDCQPTGTGAGGPGSGGSGVGAGSAAYAALDSYGDDAEAVADFGVELASRQCEALLAGGAPGLHFYSLNKAHAATQIVENLGLRD